tara:strand:+ start:343 stop:522 length:180 start_codon:yes stop_codon:yes gene_type:complete
MHNRYFDIKKDFYEVNNFENVILPIINKAKFNSEEDKKEIINWCRKTFFNQWKNKGENK